MFAPNGMLQMTNDTNAIEAISKNGKTIMPTPQWVAIADVPDEWVGQEVEWTWASEDRAKEPWCHVAGSSVLHAVRHRTNVDGPMCRVTYRGEEAEISGARLRLRIADASGRYSLFECEKSDPAGIRELLERAEREQLEVTVESAAKNGTRRGVPKLVNNLYGQDKSWVRMPGDVDGDMWLPDSWARESARPNGLFNVVSRVTLHLQSAAITIDAPDSETRSFAVGERVQWADCDGVARSGVVWRPGNSASVVRKDGSDRDLLLDHRDLRRVAAEQEITASGDDWAGIRELVERSGRENLQATVEWRGRTSRRVHKSGGYCIEIGRDESVWLPDSWARCFSAKPGGADNVVSRVTLHLTADHVRPAVQNSEHVVVREPAPEDYPTPGRFYDLNPPIKRPARERCPDCHGLGVMHTPSWKPPRDCTTCEPPAAAKVWTMEKTGDAHCGEPAAVVAWWNIAVDGVVVATVATSYRDHRDHPTGQSGLYTLASVWWGAPVPGNNRPSSRGVCEVIGEHCHEMAAARVFAGIRNGTVVP